MSGCSAKVQREREINGNSGEKKRNGPDRISLDREGKRIS